jgi:hypothetical protein
MSAASSAAPASSEQQRQQAEIAAAMAADQAGGGGGGGNEERSPDAAETNAAAAAEDETQIVAVQPRSSSFKEKKDKGRCKCNPLTSKWWVRSCDTKQAAYYYNVRTGESRWLPPCAVCSLPGKKWCITCKGSYCADDFSQYHDNTDWWQHKWAHVEPCKRDVLEKDQVYCRECGIVAATKMCTECWDPYCKSCFKLIHSVGILKTHKKKDYAKAVAGWMPVKDKSTKGGEYYVNGAMNTSTYDKPFELMTETEKTFKIGYDKFSDQLSKQHNDMEKLQFDLESTSYECAKATLELDKAIKINNKRLEMQKLMEKNK